MRHLILHTMRPLDSTGTNVVVSAQTAYNDVSQELEPRLPAIYRGNNAAITQGSTIKEWEIVYQQSFSALPGIWANFCVLANFTSI